MEEIPVTRENDQPVIIITPPVIEVEPVAPMGGGIHKGKGKEYMTEETDTSQLTIPSFIHKSVREKSLEILYEGPQRSLVYRTGPSFTGSGESVLDNTAKSFMGALPSTPQLRHSHRPFTPPIRPRTSSLTGTQPRSISGGAPINTSDLRSSSLIFGRPDAYRSFSTHSDPLLTQSPLASQASHSFHRQCRPLDLREDHDISLRLYSPQQSTESSLTCLDLSTTEQRTISRGIEKDEAMAQERAEERRKAITAKRFAGIVKTGTNCAEGDIMAEATPLGWCRGRRWEYMFNQNNPDEGTWPIRDELLDPVEVQAVGMLVPLMEMTTASTNNLVEAGVDALKDQETTGTVKYTPSARKPFKRPSLIFRLTGTRPAQPEESELSSCQETRGLPQNEATAEPKSLKHQLSSTFLKFMGHASRPHKSEGLRSLTCTTISSPSSSTVETFMVSDTNAISKPKLRLWKRGHLAGKNFLPQIPPMAGIQHPLNVHIETASRKFKQQNHNRTVLNILLGAVRIKRPILLTSLDSVTVSGAIAPTGVRGARDGHSWESEKFREAGKYVIPGIGEGGLILDRDFSNHGKSIRKIKKSYASLKPPKSGFPIFPQRANISWTNILHEYEGSLGNVKESGVRPIIDHHKESSDSLSLEIRTTRQPSSLGRSISLQLSECLTTTKMEDYEREDNEYPCLWNTDDSESEDGRGGYSIDEQNDEKSDVGSDMNNSESDDGNGNCRENDGEEEPGYGYSSDDDDDGSSADDDEDNKLRALLHQVGRTYEGYSQSGKVIRYMTKRHAPRKNYTISTASHNYRKSENTSGSDTKNPICLNHNTETMRKGSDTIIQTNILAGSMATGSTVGGRDMNGNDNLSLKDGGNENSNPLKL